MKIYSVVKKYIKNKKLWKGISGTYKYVFLRNNSTFLRKNGEKISLIDELKARGLVQMISSLELKERICLNPISIYMGIDPTASSLHVGNLVALLPLLHFYLRGHNCFLVVRRVIGVIMLIITCFSKLGGGTSRIGDPSGKTTERKILDLDAISKNCLKIEKQLCSFFENGLVYALERGYEASDIGKYYIMNNLTWYDQFSLLDFLKVVGPNVRVGEMLARDSVKSRLESNQGISFSEFTYQLLQAYDFFYLNKNYGVSIQIGGNDQWGNIVAGIGLINKINRQNFSENTSMSKILPYGITVPLLFKKNGEKFGKSSNNAIWLNSDITTPYQLYQFFIQFSDETVEKYLRMFTLLSLNTISEIMKQHLEDPSKRYAQRKLAEEVVILIHGKEEMKKSEITTQLLFLDTKKNEFETSRIIDILSNKQNIIVLNKKNVIGITISRVIKECDIALTQINKLLRSGGIYNNGEKITNPLMRITEDRLIEKKFLILRIGKKRHIIINVI
ncbi:hypothetical protein PORY_000694 [Pneumocystis oryctolagi]|uniref:Uncharacterized protein n=1 Tax=Pneumocystis oryctolagi TaxID=42067 RepID=A0ACB7CDF6_9ASCO|nr:hypothetical protein PORY_000694 [Pneumocystis oryctolagi]